MKLYPFGRFMLSLPDDHKLADIHRVHVAYDRLPLQVLAPLLAASPRGAIVDIGANVGDTAAGLRSLCANPILCIEGADDFLPHLRFNALRIDGGPLQLLDRFVLPAGLRQSPLAYVAESGTGHLHLSDAPGAVDPGRFVAVDEVVAIARDMAGGAEPALVKVDTDGLDAMIVDELLGLVECPLFFECDTIRVVRQDGNPWEALLRRFDDLNCSVVAFDNMGLPMACVDAGTGALLRDLSGWIHLQHAVTPVRVNYLDLLVFPAAHRAAYAATAASLRADLLKPYAFEAPDRP